MLFFCFRATIPKVATMDRQAKLSSLRYLLTELVEQLAEPEFDFPNWSDIVRAIREIEQLSSDLAVTRY